jgi:hypothetical protein
MKQSSYVARTIMFSPAVFICSVYQKWEKQNFTRASFVKPNARQLFNISFAYLVCERKACFVLLYWIAIF